MGQIYRMHTAEAVGEGVDYAVINNLKNAVGEVRYEEIVEQATFDLADRLGRLDRALRDEDLTMCYRHAVHICGVASQIGLSGVANVASDVLICARDAEIAALSAVVGRLNRLAEVSLFSVFDDSA